MLRASHARGGAGGPTGSAGGPAGAGGPPGARDPRRADRDLSDTFTRVYTFGPTSMPLCYLILLIDIPSTY